MKCTYHLFVIPFVVLLPALVQGNQQRPSLPVVDLGYALHQAIAFNVSLVFYTFLRVSVLTRWVGAGERRLL